MEQLPTTTLDQLPRNRVARVIELGSSGTERRRMLDMGLLPGTPIQVELTSPLGDPTAYLVRGSVLALRREQARNVTIAIEEIKEVSE